MKKISTRVGFGLSVLALSACVSSLAFAQAPSDKAQGRPQCSGEHDGKRTEAERAEHAAERFKKADKNGDGFLTQAEVGDKRWSHIQVADANRDGKISQAELAQAHADGKLGHGKHEKHPA
jgi:EF hand